MRNDEAGHKARISDHNCATYNGPLGWVTSIASQAALFTLCMCGLRPHTPLPSCGSSVSQICTPDLQSRVFDINRICSASDFCTVVGDARLVDPMTPLA